VNRPIVAQVRHMSRRGVVGALWPQGGDGGQFSSGALSGAQESLTAEGPNTAGLLAVVNGALLAGSAAYTSRRA
jgi:hypothetical protein